MRLGINNTIRKTALIIFFALSVTALACSNSESSENPTTKLQIVTTTNILADWAQQVGGERVEVFSLLPLGSDPHGFQPGARDISRVAKADVILSVGLTLEAAWLDELIENASAESSEIVTLGEVIDPIEFEGHDDEDAHEAEEHGELDPHFWFDPIRVQLAVTEIAERLSAIDPEKVQQFLNNALAYNAELDELHRWIEEQVALIPAQRRLLVTSHESFGYFGERYGFDIVGTVIPGVTTNREPSAQELTKLVERIRETGAPAIFTETTVPDRLALRIAEDAGIKVVPSLYSGSLGALDSGAETYVKMMLSNVEIIVEALR